MAGATAMTLWDLIKILCDLDLPESEAADGQGRGQNTQEVGLQEVQSRSALRRRPLSTRCQEGLREGFTMLHHGVREEWTLNGMKKLVCVNNDEKKRTSSTRGGARDQHAPLVVAMIANEQQA